CQVIATLSGVSVSCVPSLAAKPTPTLAATLFAEALVTQLVFFAHPEAPSSRPAILHIPA
ncbi:hypothetical protein KUCAC02_021219, partial [Chaenocephalus aceratus]